jgi:hypothetical protein
MADQDKRGIVVKMLVTEREKAELQAAADRASAPLAVYLRMAVLKEIRREAAKEAARAA